MNKEKNVAIYLDFENLAISALEVYRGDAMPLKLAPLIKYAESKGNLRIRKVYADWSKKKFAQYQRALISEGFELIHLPETNLLGKNGSDMRLVIDVMRNIEQFPNIDSIIIGSGDSDFIPLIQHLENREKEVIVVGFRHSVSDMLKNYCSEYLALEEILGEGTVAAAKRHSPKSQAGDAAQFVRRFLRLRKNYDPLSLSEFKQELLELDPDFDEEDFGFPKFKKFVKSLKGNVIERFERDGRQIIIHFKKPRNLRASGSSDRNRSAQRTRNGRSSHQPTNGTNGQSQQSKRSERSERSRHENKPARSNRSNQSDQSEKGATESKRKAARQLVMRYLDKRDEDDPMPLSDLKNFLLQLDATFSEKEAGYPSFKDFVFSLKGDLIKRIERTDIGYDLYFGETDTESEPPKGEEPETESQSSDASGEKFEAPRSQRKQSRNREETPDSGESSETPRRKARGKPTRIAPQSTSDVSHYAESEAPPTPFFESEETASVEKPKRERPARRQQRSEETEGERPRRKKTADRNEKSAAKSSDAAESGKQDSSKRLSPLQREAREYLQSELFYQNDARTRERMAETLLKGFERFPVMTLEQMEGYLRKNADLSVKDVVLRKYLWSLKFAGALTSSGDDGLSKRLLRLQPGINEAEALDDRYIEQITKVLSTKFDRLKNADILDLLF